MEYTKINKLTILDEFAMKKNNRSKRYFKCVCDCGNVVIKDKNKVVSGYTTSCGCVRNMTRKTLGTRNKLEYGQANFNEVYNAYKKGARLRGYEFELTKEEFKEIITKPCIYCGEEKRQHHTKRTTNGIFEYTGLDRYDNSKGYIIDNVVPCCTTCNKIKSDMSINELKNKLAKILSNIEKF